MSTEITVHSHRNNNPCSRPRKPLVHLLAADGYGSINSISFHPDDAYAIAEAIVEAARAASANRKKKTITIALKEN